MRQLLLLIILFVSVQVFSQEENKIIQFSGVVVDGNDLQPVPFTSILIKNTRRGTVCDYYGFFSIVAQKNDTIEFSAVGYKKTSYIIPDSLQENRYSLIQMLFSDTILLRETIIYPWPTKEQFKEAFLNLRIPDDDLERAVKNLSLAELKERYNSMPMDGSMNFKNQMQQYQSKLYYAGQYPPNNLLNPIAWSKFIKAWKAGELKRE
ncbi:MAG: carboxypeptidase-like regulatory domain-containing protein [Bacteroidetes bacterium]|nr:carboxypeptidase-like regulatory domain-containing protein [Bacteroidota bacterium]HET6244994.1 carboxypeptidase-like regulatory domain-containing protein [Bacteroidia bacterium]